MLLIRLVLCVILCPAVLSSNVHSVLPEGHHDTKINDGDEYGVRNYVSDHELPRDVPTRVKIVGDLGTPPPSVKLDFVPKQTYVQVRRYDAVKRLPQDAAIEEAATSEELANAPRLREVVTHKKTQEVSKMHKTILLGFINTMIVLRCDFCANKTVKIYICWSYYNNI